MLDNGLRTDTDGDGEKVYICEGCGKSFPTSIGKAIHCKHCTDYATWKDGQGKTPSPKRKDGEEEGASPYRGEGQPNEILRQILTDFPGVPPAVVKEVMSWAELWGTIPPYYRPYLLGQMKGVARGR